MYYPKYTYFTLNHRARLLSLQEIIENDRKIYFFSISLQLGTMEAYVLVIQNEKEMALKIFWFTSYGVANDKEIPLLAH